MKIAKDDFEAWRSSPVTEEVFKWVESYITDSEEQWAAQLAAGRLDDRRLADSRIELRTRIQIATYLVNVSYGDISEDEPVRNSPD